MLLFSKLFYSKLPLVAVSLVLLSCVFSQASLAQDHRSVDQVVDRYQNSSLERLLPKFVKADVEYPPKRVMMLASKKERRLELWADSGEGFKKVHTYPILHASGVSGPKLVEGDLQVPEGLYSIEALNPNSNFHLSMKLNYPNSFDRKMAAKEGRTRPGSNIFIHGKAKSKGCLAMGDQAIEDLFILAERTGIENIKVAIAPRDPRRKALSAQDYSVPEWTQGLYDEIQTTFERY